LGFSILDKLLGGQPKRSDHTVEAVDLQRFSGRWYEIAGMPSWFEKGCRRSMAEYVNKGDHLVITASCEVDGKLVSRTGKAVPIPGTNNAQLKIQFFKFLTTEYWVIGLDDDYQHSVIGHPAQKYLWIMSRAPQMEEGTYHSLVELAGAKGYDVSKLRKVDQPCPEEI
jgi:apolipoprotein D and lipocalin family protein